MSRRTTEASAAQAAEAASEAARVLQAHGQQAKRETLHLPKKEAEAKPEAEAPKTELVDNERIKQIPRGNIHRDAIMEEIRQRRGEDKTEEAKPEEPKPETQEAPKEADSVPAGSSSEPVEAAVEAVVEAPETVRVKVNGREFDAPKADVEAAGGIAAYQRDLASQEHLKEAKEAAAEMKKLAALIAEAAKPKEPPAPVATDPELIDKLRFGTPEESAAALQQLTARNRVDPNEITHRAIANMQFNAAERQFHKDFADLARNPLAARLVKSLKEEALQKLVQEGRPNWGAIGAVDWIGFFNTMGTQIRSAFGRPHQSASTPAATQGTTSPQSEKEARKASIAEPKSAAARATPKEEPILTPEETRLASLREMRKSRGLPVD